MQKRLCVRRIIKFEQRFRKVEEKALERGSSVKDLSLIEMDILWDEVKREER